MRVILAAGGTAGHIYPALCVARALRREGHELSFLTNKGPGEAMLRKEGFDVRALPVRGLAHQSLLNFFRACGYLFISITQAFRWMRFVRPDVVVGFGGYASFPAGMVGRLLRIPTMIHEQNVIPGRANQYLGKWTNRVMVSFKESTRYFKNDKVAVTGCPLRFQTLGRRRQEILSKLKLNEGITTLLILGGSQGSAALNHLVLEALPELLKTKDYQVVHITGPGKDKEIKEKYKGLSLRAVVYDYYEAMDELYTVADMAVSRAGAMTVCELSHFCVPTVYVPYPFAGGHQKANAIAAKRVNRCLVVDQEGLTGENLASRIECFADELSKAGDIQQPSGKIDATQRIVEEIKRIWEEKR